MVARAAASEPRHSAGGTHDMPEKLRVLFLCTGNSCRSQMAEGLCRQLRGDLIEAASAGIGTYGLNPSAVKVMEEVGVDISSHRGEPLEGLASQEFDYVVTLCAHAHETCPVFPGEATVIHRGFDDPPALAADAADEEEVLPHYRSVRDEIRDYVLTLPASLAADARQRGWLAVAEPAQAPRRSLVMSGSRTRMRRLGAFLGEAFLFAVTSLSAIAVLFIFYFIAKDAIPFFRMELGGFNVDTFTQFFTSTKWYPSAEPGSFGCVGIFYGSAIVTVGAMVVAVPLGIAAAVCLSDVLPFAARQIVKPVIEVLAAIPSVAFGFFALVVFAPLLQNRGGHLLAVAAWLILLPVLVLATAVIGDVATDRCVEGTRKVLRPVLWVGLGGAGLLGLTKLGQTLHGLEISSGANAFNVSIILGIMALPTVVSVSEDALQAVGRELREGSYALGATRAETLMRTIIPAATSGICAAVILGLMRAVGETMVVWMASGNAAQVPTPWYNCMAPVRTLTATIAGDMGEADHVTGSYRYHVLFAMALCLLAFSFLMNLVSEYVVRVQRRRLGQES